MLFHQLTPDLDGKYGRKVSDFFNTNYKNVGVLKFVGIEKKNDIGANRNFHSFRKTLRDEFKQIGSETSIVNEIMGHEHTDTGNKVYADEHSLKIKQKEINKITFDFTHPRKWEARFF